MTLLGERPLRTQPQDALLVKTREASSARNLRCVIMISKTVSSPAMNGALCKVSSGRDMPKLSPASWRLTPAILKVSWRFLENMESSSLNILLRLGQVTSSNGSLKRRTKMTWITLHEWLLMHILTYRRQGRSHLGLRMPEGTVSTSTRKANVWEARGVPSQWSTGVPTSRLTKHAACCSGQNIRQNHFVLPMKMPMGRFSQFFRHVKTPKQTPIKAAGKSMGHANFWHSLNGDKGVSKPKETVVIAASTQNEESMPEAPTGETASAAAGAEIKRTAPQGSSPEKKRAIRTWQLWNPFSRIWMQELLHYPLPYPLTKYLRIWPFLESLLVY